LIATPAWNRLFRSSLVTALSLGHDEGEAMDGSGVGLQDKPATRTAHYGITIPSISRDQFDLRELFVMLRRRRAIILGSIAVITVLATIITFALKPKYTAETSLLLDSRKTNVIDLQAVMGGLQPEAAAIRSEVDVLRSPQLIAKVIDKLGLVGNPDFNDELHNERSLWTSLRQGERNLVAWLGAHGFGPAPRTAELTPEEEQQQTIMRLTDKLLDHLVVGNDQRSYTIKLTYTADEPTLAARVVNAVAELYLTDQLDAKFEATKRANTWLSNRVSDLKDQVTAAEQAVQAYREQNKLTVSDAKGTTVAMQQLGELNSQLILSSADRAQKEARLRQFQDALKKGTVSSDAPEVMASPLIAQLRSQETEVVRKLADLSAHYGERYPAVINARAELRDVRSQIAQETNKIVGNLAQDVQVSRIREQSLQQNLAEMQKRSATNNSAEVKLHELDREAQASRTLYEDFLSRFKETSQQQDIQQPDARIIARADVPVDPSFPNKKLFVALALIGSTLIGVLLAIIIERLDNGFRAGEQIEQATGISALGMVPSVSTGLGAKPEDVVLRKPSSAFAESIRSVRTAILYSHVDRPPRALLITSAVPEEGKSLLSISLARSSAKAGQKVLLIDADLRRPKIGKLLKARGDGTLADLFAGQRALDEVINRDEESGMHFICARAGMPNPQDLLGSQHMRDFVRSIAQHYDLVIVDSPPVLAASDSLVLSRIVDATVFVVRWEKTPRQVVLGALKQLQGVGGSLAGVVLSRVNVRKHARFGYGDHGYYYGTYKEYAG
jgi:succinoglycan biosynthesis transport protein ExoP